jgi:SAM-dependent methyltransferase
MENIPDRPMTPTREQLKDLCDRFPTTGERCYARGKLATDPLYPAVRRALGERDVVPLLDIGCGMGVLAFYLRITGWKGPIRGLDYDARKIETANRLAPGFPGEQRFECADAMQGLPDHLGHVTILDILQYFPKPDRTRLLEEAARRVAPGSMLVLRTGLAAPGWRFRVTRFMDHVAKVANWMKSPPLHYPTASEIESLLRGAGLEGSLVPLWGRTPFNNWLGVFSRAE